MKTPQHCGQAMRVQVTDLHSGGKRYDFTCGYCGQREREIYGSRGYPIAWVNLTAQEKDAAMKVAAGNPAGV